MKYILILILLWLLTRCASFIQPTKALSLKADFFVSTITKDISICQKETCVLYISDDEVQLCTRETNLIVTEFAFGLNREAKGKDRYGVEWEIAVGNMHREPYLLILESDSVSILIGYKCYQKDKKNLGLPL